MTTGEWVALFFAIPFAVAFCCLPIAWRRGQRRCDRLNAENAAAWETWRVLTEEDREWLLSNGATQPSLIYWEMR